MKALRSIIHHNASVDEAQEIFLEEQKK